MLKFEKRSADGVEVRSVQSAKVNIRRGGNTKRPVLIGYAAVFNSRTVIGSFCEEIAPGAFAQAIADGSDVRALYNHQDSLILGRRSAGTLKLEEDTKGLLVEIELPDTQAARDLMANIDSGNINGMSFGFRAREQEWSYSDGESQDDVRRLIDLDLIEVSPVVFPSYEQTVIQKKG